ncbi:peptidyl-tRNA hydrolase-like isoform X1 [Schistocerca gregaria]|uniref:peptidyl-tRNA hydrolase-like isoform X1 n=1 Tax=Schistocerca gregaria TaxID=7010 RepID=UPI00211DBEE3|nr:peptidyl-tRNA hydrolase-like isoform X1 [Schistocerca gregaria]
MNLLRGKVEGDKLFFAVGNHMFPKSRYSIGLQLIDHIARKAKSRWFLDKNSFAHVTMVGTSILARPITYIVKENYRSLDALIKNYKLKLDNITVLTYSSKMQLGSAKLVFGSSTHEHDALQPISECLQTEDYKCLEIGTMQPDYLFYDPDVLTSHDIQRAEIQQFFLANKFNEDEQFALEQFLLSKIEETLDSTNQEKGCSYTYHQVMKTVEKLRLKQSITN